MTTQLYPINNLPNLYVNNLQIKNNASNPNTQIDVAAGACRDSNNVMDLVLASGVTINCALNGLNGLDSGSLANSTWYYVFVIGDSSGHHPTGCLMSTSKTAPVLPFGYDSLRWIGVARTDGSAHLLLMYVSGGSSSRWHMWDSSISVLSTGGATSLTAVDLGAAVPPIDMLPVWLEVQFTPNAAADSVAFAPFGSTATALPRLSGSVASVQQDGQLQVMSRLNTTAKVLYINSAASGSTTASVTAFSYSI